MRQETIAMVMISWLRNWLFVQIRRRCTLFFFNKNHQKWYTGISGLVLETVRSYEIICVPMPTIAGLQNDTANSGPGWHMQIPWIFCQIYALLLQWVLLHQLFIHLKWLTAIRRDPKSIDFWEPIIFQRRQVWVRATSDCGTDKVVWAQDCNDILIYFTELIRHMWYHKISPGWSVPVLVKIYSDIRNLMLSVQDMPHVVTENLQQG